MPRTNGVTGAYPRSRDRLARVFLPAAPYKAQRCFSQHAKRPSFRNGPALDCQSSVQLLNTSSRRAHHGGDHEQNEENEEQDLGDARGRRRDAAKSKNRRDDRDNKKNSVQLSMTNLYQQGPESDLRAFRSRLSTGCGWLGSMLAFRHRNWPLSRSCAASPARCDRSRQRPAPCARRRSGSRRSSAASLASRVDSVPDPICTIGRLTPGTCTVNASWICPVMIASTFAAAQRRSASPPRLVSTEIFASSG